MGPSLLEIAIRITPRMRDWMFSSVVSGARLANTGASMWWKASTAGSIGTSSRRMPEQGGAGGGIVEAVARGVARGHHHRVDALGPERIDRDRGREGRVDAARQAEHHAGEAVLGDIVVQAQDHGAVDRLQVRQGRGDRAALHRLQALVGAAPPAGQRQRLDEAGRLRHQAAIGVQRERAAVEHQLVLAADLVDVEQRQAGLGDARHGQLQPLVLLAVLERRAVGDDQDLGPALAQAPRPRPRPTCPRRP